MNRDINIDILRIIGLLAVILAHVQPPKIIMQLRTFDVPLMVLVSGVAFSMTYAGNNKLAEYFKKRVLRLLLPTWIFLTLFFSYFGIVDLVTNGNYLSLKLIVNSYSLFNLGGIGYVWIIRVFILVAIGAPLVYHVSNRFQNSVTYFIVLALMFIIYFSVVDIYLSVYGNESNLLNQFIKEYVFYLIPYLLIFSIGFRLQKLTVKHSVYISISLLILFLIILIPMGYESFLGINEYKYPPQLLWTIYGIMISVFLYNLIPNINYPPYCHKTIFFLSESSLWIYLWHIFLLKNWSYGISHIPEWAKSFIIKFLIICLLSSIITFIQKNAISLFLSKFQIKGYWRKIILEGFLK